MADLLAILSQGASSLGAYRAATATTSQNLQNANTEGYARQTAELETALPVESTGNSFVGRGVSLKTVRQARDRFIEAQLPKAMGTAAQASAEADSLSSLSALDPDKNGGMTEALSNFFSGMTELSQNPGSSVLRQSAINSANGLAAAFNRTAQSISDARDGIDQKITSQVSEANQTARQMAELNVQIRTARASGGGEPNDLLDARLRLQDRLATSTGARAVTNSHGDVMMVLPSGTSLVGESNAATLSTVANPSNNGHVDLRVTLADGSGPIAIPSAGGSIGGLVDARDGALKTAVSSLDQLAYDIANAVNKVHSSGYALDKSIGRNLFDIGKTVPGAASRMAVDSKIAGDSNLLAASTSPNAPSGDASNIFRLTAIERQPLSGGLDPSSALSQIVSDYGTAVDRANTTSQSETAVRDHLLDMRESASGVSVDEELVNLTRAQRAFEAIAKVITTTSSMLDTLMQLK